MKKLLILTYLSLMLFSCQKKATYSLFVFNQGDSERNKIADFYQKVDGKKDCELLRDEWRKNYPNAFCEKASN